MPFLPGRDRYLTYFKNEMGWAKKGKTTIISKNLVNKSNPL